MTAQLSSQFSCCFRKKQRINMVLSVHVWSFFPYHQTENMTLFFCHLSFSLLNQAFVSTPYLHLCIDTKKMHSESKDLKVCFLFVFSFLFFFRSKKQENYGWTCKHVGPMFNQFDTFSFKPNTRQKSGESNIWCLWFLHFSDVLPQRSPHKMLMWRWHQLSTSKGMSGRSSCQANWRDAFFSLFFAGKALFTF